MPNAATYRMVVDGLCQIGDFEVGLSVFKTYSLLFLPKTIKSIGMWRQSWSSAFVVFKTIKVFLAFQRQSSLLACGDNHGHLLSLFLSTYCSIISATIKKGEMKIKLYFG